MANEKPPLGDGMREDLAHWLRLFNGHPAVTPPGRDRLDHWADLLDPPPTPDLLDQMADEHWRSGAQGYIRREAMARVLNVVADWLLEQDPEGMGGGPASQQRDLLREQAARGDWQ